MNGQHCKDKFKKKITINLSPNTTKAAQATILEILGVDEANAHDKYLGLPSVVGRHKQNFFEVILDLV